MDGVGGRSQDSVIRLAVLALVIAFGAYLRFDALGTPSYWLDEVLGQQLTSEALAQPWWRWLTGFEAEHGPLYYATQAATRVAGSDEFAGRLAAALFGLATIPLVAVISSQFAGGMPQKDEEVFVPSLWRPGACALAASALLALSPFHVYYSREARPYALLMLLTAVLLLLLVRGASWRPVSLVLVAMLYTSAVAAPILAASAIAALFSRRRTAWLPHVVIGIAFLLLYRRPPVETPGVPFRAMDFDLFAAVLRSFTVSASGADANGRTVIALSAFAVLGAYVLYRRSRLAALTVLSMTVLPVAFAVAALKITGHWFAVRYIGPGLIGFVVLAGAGISAAAMFAARRRAFAYGLTLLILGATARETWGPARREPFQKLDWRGITARIARYAQRGDVVIAAEPWTGIISDYYLARLPDRGVVDIQTSLVPIANQLRAEHPATFIISTNAPEDTPMRKWACEHPLILASPIDGFRMHYAGDFLRERAQEPERRAIRAGLADAVLYRDGWASVEGSGADAFRWAIGERATMVVPGTVRLRLLPLEHPSLPEQRVAISVNGRFVRELTLKAGWTDHLLEVPEGLATVTFAFARATAPASFDPRNGDTRRLAVAFQLPPHGNVQTRIASSPLLDEDATWRNTRTNFASSGLRQDAVLPLLGRLGFDPSSVWPRLQRGELHLEDLAESIAYGSECLDDAAFVRMVYDLLLHRAPVPGETLRMARARFIGRIVKSDEFRTRYEASQSLRLP